MAEPDREQRAGRQVDTDLSARPEEVLHLLDQLTEVAQQSAGLFRAIEQVTGLRVGEIQVLRAVHHDGAEVREVARRIGQADNAVKATVDGLIRRQLVDRDQRAGPRPVLRLTDAGRAALEQTQGVQIRLLDTLIGEVGADGARAFRTTLQGIADVLRTLARRARSGTGGGSAVTPDVPEAD